MERLGDAKRNAEAGVALVPVIVRRSEACSKRRDGLAIPVAIIASLVEATVLRETCSSGRSP